jgi:hypothetical protein
MDSIRYIIIFNYRGTKMKKIKHLKEYSEFFGGILMALLFALYVYFSDWVVFGR